MMMIMNEFHLNLSSSHDGNQVNLSHIVYKNVQIASHLDNHRSQGVFFRDYYPNGEWDIIRAPATRNQKKYSCCSQPYYDITYALVLKRKTLFYTVHLIIPCIGISLLTFVVFYLPSQSGEKIVLCISIELALTVIFPLLADLIPSISTMMPLLGKYLLFIMLLVALSIIKTIIILSIYYRNENVDKQMSKWMKKIFIDILPPLLLLSEQNERILKILKRKHRRKLPKDQSLDAMFVRMLEKLLRLEDLQAIFGKFDNAILKDKVTNFVSKEKKFSSVLNLVCTRLATCGLSFRSNSIDYIHDCFVNRHDYNSRSTNSK